MMSISVAFHPHLSKACRNDEDIFYVRKGWAQIIDTCNIITTYQ